MALCVSDETTMQLVVRHTFWDVEEEMPAMEGRCRFYSDSFAIRPTNPTQFSYRDGGGGGGDVLSKLTKMPGVPPVSSWSTLAESTDSWSDLSSCMDDSDRDSSSQPDERTTVILEGLPTNLSRLELVDMIAEAGCASLCDFVYLPYDLLSKASVGHAYINLVNSDALATFWQVFDGYQRWVVPSTDVCQLKFNSTFQGHAECVEKFRNSQLMHKSVPEEFKPLLFTGGVPVPFPAPTKMIRAPRPRHARKL